MSELKFKFEDSQQYQLDAIAAMTDIFTGAERADNDFRVGDNVVILKGAQFDFVGKVGTVQEVPIAQADKISVLVMNKTKKFARHH